MSERMVLPGPVAVGGVGGSGTRVIAQMLIKLGFYMGAYLSEPRDNLWFTILFRQPKWFMRNADQHPARIAKRWQLFEKAMTGCLKPQPNELAVILQAAAAYSAQSLWPGWSLSRMVTQRVPLAIGAVRSLLRSADVDLSAYVGWGWKAPNTQFYLTHIIDHFETAKYVQVIRHGLDMAFRGRQKQLHNWGSVVGAQKPQTIGPQPEIMLDYWIKINRTVISQGQERLGKRFHVVNFDQLCLSPRQEADKLLAFLEITDVSADTMSYLLNFPRMPAKSGRYRDRDLSIFSPEEIRAVQELGFSVD